MAKTLQEKIQRFFKDMSPANHAMLWGLITLAGVLVIFSSYYLPGNFFVSEGEVSQATIEADKSVTYEDTAKTEANRQAAAEKVGDIFVFDSAVLEGQVDQLNQLFKAWEDLALLSEDGQAPAGQAAAGSESAGNGAAEATAPTAGNQEPTEPKSRMEQAAPYIAQLQIKESTAKAILSLDSITLQSLRSEAVNIMTEQWTKGVRKEEVEEARKRILDEVYLRINNEEQVSFLQAVFRFINLDANFIFDEETTMRAREEAASKEPPVLNTVYRNQKVIGKGEVVTANHIEILKALGYQRSKAPYVMLVGVAVFTAGIFFLLSLYLKQFPPKNLADGKHYTLLSLLFLMILAVARLIVAINISPEPIMAEQVAYLIPASAGSILIAILMDSWLGVFFGTVVSLYIGILAGGGLSYTIVAFAGSMIGIYGISRYAQRSEWAKAGLMIALVNSWMIIGMGIMNNHARMTIFYGVILGVVNGFFSPILAYGSLPFLESAFHVTTSVSLMELSNPRQPLLKELLLKAPGTYHHSILVGNLAEAAADAVGADPILVRVGAYYHDIGKTRRPYFFVENQLAGANPHDKLTPALSALILSSHVKDGLEIGRKNKLPEKVLDFIVQHHGDSIMAFFYHKALEEAEDPEKVKESDFRYPGPRPQSKETALVMLADSVEAAIRSMNVSGDKMEAAVKKLINDKVADGQLEDSHLSLSDLKTIGQSFTQVLNGIYHSRIEYPENVLAVMKKGMEKTEDNPGEQGEGTAAEGPAAEGGTGKPGSPPEGAAEGAGKPGSPAAAPGSTVEAPGSPAAAPGSPPQQGK